MVQLFSIIIQQKLSVISEYYYRRAIKRNNKYKKTYWRCKTIVSNKIVNNNINTKKNTYREIRTIERERNKNLRDDQFFKDKKENEKIKLFLKL